MSLIYALVTTVRTTIPRVNRCPELTRRDPWLPIVRQEDDTELHLLVPQVHIIAFCAFEPCTQNAKKSAKAALCKVYLKNSVPPCLMLSHYPSSRDKSLAPPPCHRVIFIPTVACDCLVTDRDDSSLRRSLFALAEERSSSRTCEEDLLDDSSPASRGRSGSQTRIYISSEKMKQ
jgi:hypothetical protein